MKLVQTPKGISFYESFSDLIFGTLCIFIIVVFSLVLKIKQAEDVLRDEVRQLVSPNRFTGGSDETHLLCEYVERNGRGFVYFTPNRHANNLALVTPVEDIVEEMKRAIREDQYLSIPVDQLAGFSSGTIALNPRSWNGIRLELQQHWGSERLLEMDFGTQYLGVWESQLGPLFRRLDATYHNSPSLRFSTVEGKQRFRVGDFEMSSLHFKNLLRSIKPGSGFCVEYLDEQGGSGSEPPNWVRDVLTEVGYDGRTLRVNAMNELLRQE